VGRFRVFVTLCFIACIILFIATFFYLDKERHGTYYYTVIKDGYEIGTITIDKYYTEDRAIYKSVSNIPLAGLYTECNDRIDMDRKHNLISFLSERTANGATESYYLASSKESVSFVSIYNGEFAFLDNYIVNKRPVFSFESPLTYMPLIESYDFRTGASQGFSVLLCPFPDFSLPPVKVTIAFTSILDEYLKIERRKIKTEKLILRLKGYPQINFWVAKSDRTIMKMEMPSEGLSILRAFSLKNIAAKAPVMAGEPEYHSKDVSFKSKEADLSGTLCYPKKDAKFPAIILVWGAGPQDKDYQGFFMSMADFLAKNGYAVLRFDKEGVGGSSGNFQSAAMSDYADDICASIDFLASQKEIDPARIAVLSHAAGSMYALKAMNKRSDIRASIFMAPYVVFNSEDDRVKRLKWIALKFDWPEEYVKNATRAVLLTLDMAKRSDRNWITVLGKRCFTVGLRDEMGSKCADLVRNIKAPVLILQGKQDDRSPMETASDIDKLLTESGNQSHTLTYFSYLGHFFGTRTNDGIHRQAYVIDKEVLDTIKKWLDKTLPEKLPETLTEPGGEKEMAPPDISV